MKKTTPLILILLFLMIGYIFSEKRHHIFLIFFILLFTILLIQLMSIPRCQKNILAVIILVLYYRNIMLGVEMSHALITIPFKYPPDKRNDNNIPKSIVNRIFNKYFCYSSNIDSIPINTKTIYVSNYVSDRFENFACIMIPNISIILGDTFVKTFKLHKVICNLIPRKPGNNQYDIIKKDIKTQYDNGFSIFAYIEEPSTVIGNGVGRLRSGMFSIAKELNITITPVVFDHIEYNKFGIIYNQNYRIKIGNPFYVQDIKDSKYKVRKFFRDSLKQFKRKKFENIY